MFPFVIPLSQQNESTDKTKLVTQLLGGANGRKLAYASCSPSWAWGRTLQNLEHIMMDNWHFGFFNLSCEIE